MRTIDLELKLKQIDASDFQRLCDLITIEEGHVTIPYGNCEGRKKVRKGTPDSYFINSDQKSFTFIESTTQENDIIDKINRDIDKCIVEASKLKIYTLSRIIYFWNLNNLSPSDYTKLVDRARGFNIELDIRLSEEIIVSLRRFPDIVLDIFGEKLIDNNFFSLNDFIEFTKKYKGINHSFEYCKRAEDEEKIAASLKDNFITVIHGDAGVGKSMLVVQTLRKLNKKIICLNSANVSALEEINSILRNQNDLILFVDDVNEIASFEGFLNSLKEENTKEFKIICTIREFAVADLKKILSKFNYNVSFIKIEKMNDILVKEMLKVNFGIIDLYWINKISNIAKGNARLAFMAGRVASENGVEKLVDSYSILKEYFNCSNSEKITHIIKEYCDELGVIAFLNKINISNEEYYLSYLDFFKIEKDRFIKSLSLLKDLELINIFEGSIVEISDQNFADFFIEKAFAEHKIWPLHDVFIEFIHTRKEQIANLYNVLNNIYSSDDNKEYLKNEISITWDYLKDKQEFCDFVSLFYFTNMERALVECYKKLTTQFSKIEKYENFNKKIINNDYVSIISSIAKNGVIEAYDALFELLSYETIRDQVVEEIENLVCVKFSYELDGKTSDFHLASYLKKYIDREWFNDVALKIVLKGLQFNFKFIVETDKSSFAYKQVFINDNCKNIIQYRNYFWDLSICLTENYKYLLITNFSDFWPNECCDLTYKNDLSKIMELLSSIKNRDEIIESVFKFEILDKLQNCKIEQNFLKIYSESKLNKIKLILNCDYFQLKDGPKITSEDDIKAYVSNSSIDEIKNDFVLCGRIGDFLNKFICNINIFIWMVLNELDNEKIIGLLDVLFLNELPAFVKSEIITYVYIKVNKKVTLNVLKENIKNKDYLICAFILFDRLKPIDINADMKQLFNECLIVDLKNNDNINIPRKCSTLLKLSDNNSEFVKKIVQVYNEKLGNEFKVNSWLKELFSLKSFNDTQLVDLFNKEGQLKLLEEILCFLMKNKKSNQTIGRYVYSIYKLDKNFLKTIIKKIFDINDTIYMKYDLLSNLWSFDNSYELADYVFDECLPFENALIDNLFVEQVFLCGNCFDKVAKWAKKKIMTITNEEAYRLLMRIVVLCPIDLTKDIYIEFAKRNAPVRILQDCFFFMGPFMWVGSEINLIYESIDKLNTISNFLPEGINYLEYKIEIGEICKGLKRRIKQVRIDEKIRKN